MPRYRPSSSQDSFTLQYNDVARAGVVKKESKIPPARPVTHSIHNLLPGRNYSVNVWAIKDINRKVLRSSIATIFVNTSKAFLYNLHNGRRMRCSIVLFETKKLIDGV